MDINVNDLEWRKSSMSGGQSDCLELATVAGTDMVAFRESDDPGVVVVTSRRKLAAFLGGAKNGEFDDLI